METIVSFPAPHPYVTDSSRLRALEASGLLSEDIEPALDRWTRLAGSLVGAPLALLTLIDADRQVFKSHVGLPPELAEGRETPLSHSFCQHVVAREATFVVEDAREDPLVQHNGAVKDLGVRAYAGEPITTSDGHTLGAFCVVDTVARVWTADELALLKDLAAGLLAEVELRAALRTSVALQAELGRQARVDVLTGLSNRRRLVEDLDETVGREPARVLAMFDLDGFKAYNDLFGHPAGDGLLSRLGHRLQEVVEAVGGAAYRLGGDEFCVLVDDEEDVRTAAGALREHGDGFTIESSYGTVVLDASITSTEHAMNVVDERLYAAKNKRSAAGREVQAVLLGVLREREPSLDEHVREVGVLARRVAIRLGLSETDVQEVVAAAHLHDIGKVAIPDSILAKAGPLDEEEMAIMRRHTLLGERIIGAAPALRSVALLVRASHERWDGGGYPDGLVGEAIPLGARIVLVCDAYLAVTSDRPYARARSASEAQDELRRHAGSQFDPTVVEALFDVVDRPAGPGAPPA